VGGDTTLDHQETASVPGPTSPGVPLIITTPVERNGSRVPERPPTFHESRRDRRARRRARIRRRRTWFGRHPKSTIALVVLLALTPVWVSAGSAATNPALGLTVGSRLTEWVRDHGGGSIVTWAENTWYSWHAPPKGGKPRPGAIPRISPVTTTTVPAGPAHLPPPAPITPFVAAPLPGEGHWQPIGRSVDGIPAMYAAYLRPNAVNTSLVTGVAWMDTTLLSATLYAGSIIPSPGPPWPNQAPIPSAALSTLDAAFNSGFRMQDSRGGFYLDGMTSLGYPLVPGAASFVIMSNGTATVGTWGTDVAMSPSVVAVRQNLALIVNNSQPVPGLDANDNHQWGFTLGGAVQVWRSGVGVTADGALVYAAGSGLSIVDLADVLARAGAVRAMELDINTDWVNFTSFAPALGQLASPVNGTTLTRDEVAQPSRYFAPLARDFITMSVRPPATPAPPSTPATHSGRTTRPTTKG
jgi:Phosphodiester glycosidase